MFTYLETTNHYLGSKQIYVHADGVEITSAALLPLS